ncbi:MAG TPA: DsbA family oxidoreductase [Mycobacteriales bacterium]|nr:DsbA family oxidoreductase [Mycobacteriales bacterium]
MRVEIWSDVVCPWCAIGKAHLDAALARFEHADAVEVVWRSFELDPGAPPVRDGDYAALLAGKYGTNVAGGQAMIDRVTGVAATAGVTFHLDRARSGNSFDAHRLVHLAADRGIQTQVKERFLRGYLSEGQAVGDHDVLERLAVDAGLDRAEVRRVLDSGDYADAVRADEAEAARLGVGGVPMFLVDRRFAIPGAQPAEVILDTLRRAWDSRQPAVTVVGADHAAGDAPVCGPDGCTA